MEKYEKINGWKSEVAFIQQLNLNTKQFKEGYPPHWYDFINLVKSSGAKSILDIGCGCGFYYNLCLNNIPDLSYKGIDYAEEAIKVARESFSLGDFDVMDVWDINDDYIRDFDVIHLGALLDVLPNGDDLLKFILSLNAPKIILGRVKLTNECSFYKEYTVYQSVETYEYHHNSDTFFNMISDCGYSINRSGDTFLLIKS